MDEIDELESWEASLAKWLESIVDKMFSFNLKILDRLQLYIDKLEDDFSQNLKTLVEAQIELPTILASMGFTVLVDEIVTKITESIDKLEGYFKNNFQGFNEKTAEIATAYKKALKNVRKSLLGEGIERNYVTNIMKVLQLHIFGKSQKSVVREELKSVLSKAGQPLRYVSVYTSDALYQFSRAYTNEVTKDLKAKYFYYMGTKIKTTRDFCDSKAGKVFKKSEVLSWINSEWRGKIPGTTAQNIFVYVGGYNCRHRLLPISEEMFFQLGGNLNDK